MFHRIVGLLLGEIEVFKEYEAGLKDIDRISHLVILWLFHKFRGYSLHVKPLHHKGIRGVFATRIGWIEKTKSENPRV